MYNFYRMKHVFLTSQKNRNNPPAGIEYFDLSFANFSYTDYVSSCTTHLFVKMIHVGWRVWCTVIAVVSMLCLVLYLIDDPTDTLGNQLHNMWLSDGHFVQDNNFVVDRMNVIGELSISETPPCRLTRDRSLPSPALQTRLLQHSLRSCA